MLSGRDTIFRLIAGQINPKSSVGRVKVELDLSNYAMKADLKYATSVDPSKFVNKLVLANLKSDVDKSGY